MFSTMDDVHNFMTNQGFTLKPQEEILKIKELRRKQEEERQKLRQLDKMKRRKAWRERKQREAAMATAQEL